MFIINRDFENGYERDTYTFENKEEAIAKFIEECGDDGQHLYLELLDNRENVATWEWDGEEGIRVTGFKENGFEVPEVYMDGSFIVMEDDYYLVAPEEEVGFPWDWSMQKSINIKGKTQKEHHDENGVEVIWEIEFLSGPNNIDDSRQVESREIFDLIEVGKTYPIPFPWKLGSDCSGRDENGHYTRTIWKNDLS